MGTLIMKFTPQQSHGSNFVSVYIRKMLKDGFFFKKGSHIKNTGKIFEDGNVDTKQILQQGNASVWTPASIGKEQQLNWFIQQ